MSATNWARCPRCLAAERQRRIDAGTKAREQYGKIASWEYDRLVKESEEPIQMTDKLREDYFIGFYEDGSFVVNYRAECQRCGLSHEFKHEQGVA